ncbi:MAG: rhamnan synthesis F family protein [Desulfovibrio sp.]|jgi:hypothetical protein|nr:rhamnan synthesis F family protein [Desulfovibrio sp.]
MTTMAKRLTARLRTTPLWSFIRWAAKTFVYLVPLSVCRHMTMVPWLGLIASARLLSQETCVEWFTGTPGKQLELIPGLNAREPQAVKKAWELLPHKPEGIYSILEHCHVVKGEGKDFSGEKVALMAHWDPENKVDPFVSYYLRHFRQAGFKTVLASAAPLAADDDDIAHTDAVVHRTCGGYDFTSWKGALECFPSLRHAAELVFTNDSVFAPLADIGRVHAAMDSVSCDFWGLMESRDQLPAMPSFYIVCRQRTLQHPCFKTFWDGVDTSSHKETVVWRFEQSQTLWFALHGLTPGAYIHWDMMPWLKGGPAYACWKQLVQLFRVPCIKRSVINGDVWWANPTGWEILMAQSEYPPGLARDFLERCRRVVRPA